MPAPFLMAPKSAGQAGVPLASDTKRIDTTTDTVDLQSASDEQIGQYIAGLIEASRGSDSPDAALEYSQRAADLSPDDPDVQEHLQALVFDRLRQDPSVSFLAETPKHYIVSFRGSRPLMVPKARSATASTLERPRTEAERTFGLLRWMIIGLIPAGIGALILSPLAIGRAVGVLAHGTASRRDRRLAWLTIGVAAVAGLLGMIFSLALALHILG